VIGVPLVLVGLALAVIGLRVATEQRRPASLAGALLAPAGLWLAFLGAARLASPGFFGP